MLDKANAYFEGTLSGDSWNTFQDDDKEKALKEASQMIERIPLINAPNDVTQAAIYEQALCLLTMSDDQKERLSLRLQGITSVHAGNASESYESLSNSGINGYMLCPKVAGILGAYLPSVTAKGGRIITKRCRGGCDV